MATTGPIVGNDSPETMQKNRRVELVILPNVEEMLDLKSLTLALIPAASRFPSPPAAILT